VTPSQRYRQFMETLTILNRRSEITPLILNPAQALVWEAWAPLLDAKERLWSIVLKARRHGVSTMTQALLFAYGFAVGNGETLTLAHEGESAHSIFEIQRRMYEHLPLAKPRTTPKSEIWIASPEGYVSHRVATAGAEAKGRGKSPIALHLSEVAFWPYPETMNAVLNSMPPPSVQSVVVLESTANGKTNKGGLFYEEWMRAEQGDSGILPVFLPWFVLPEYQMADVELTTALDPEETELVERFHVKPAQIAWFRYALHTLCQGDPLKRAQEYPSTPEEAFVSSGLPAFDPRVLARQRVNLKDPERFSIHEDGTRIANSRGELSIWRHPDGAAVGSGKSYLIAVDTAPGGHFDVQDSRDTRSWSACIVLDTVTGAQVGEWYGPLDGEQLAGPLFGMATKVFPNALVAIEVNGSGRYCQRRLLDHYRYSRLHPWRGKVDRVHRGKFNLWGWETNAATRPGMLSNAQFLLAQDAVTIRSKRLLSQMEDLTRTDEGRYEAEVGRDDLAMAFMIALMSWEENFRQFGHRVPGVGPQVEVGFEQMGIRPRPAASRAVAEHWKKVRGGKS